MLLFSYLFVHMCVRKARMRAKRKKNKKNAFFSCIYRKKDVTLRDF